MAVTINATIKVEKFYFDPENQEDDRLLEIGGRNTGIIALILGWLGLGTQSSLIITRSDVRFVFRGLSGVNYIVCPFHAVRCVETGVAKPLWMAIAGVVAVLFGLITLFTSNFFLGLILLAVGAGLIYWYIVSNNLAITFSTGSMGDMRGLGFGSGIISGMKLDRETILDAIDHVNEHMVAIRAGRGGVTSQPVSAGTVRRSRPIVDDTASTDSVPAAELGKRLAKGLLAGTSVVAGKLQEAAEKTGQRINESRAENSAVSEPPPPKAKPEAPSPKVRDDTNARHEAKNTQEMLAQRYDEPSALPKTAMLSNDAQRAYKRGYRLYQDKKYITAIEELGKAITLDPNYTDAYGCRAMCYKALNDAEHYKADVAVYKRLSSGNKPNNQ
jgi:hypothetical protein